MKRTIPMHWWHLGGMVAFLLGSFVIALFPHVAKNGWDLVASMVAFVATSTISFFIYRWCQLRIAVGAEFGAGNLGAHIRLFVGPLWAAALWYIATIGGAVTLAFLFVA